MKRTKVMIVEDEVILAMGLKLELQNLGYEICQLFTSGEKAIENIENENPDIVLMDINLNGELDGIESASQIINRFNIPIIYLTGYANPALRKRAEATKPVGYFIKPLECEKLQKAIDSSVNKKA